MEKEPLSVMIDYQKNRTDTFIALVNEYQILGEKITSEGYVLQRGKADATKTLAEYNNFAIQQHNKQGQKFINLTIQNLNEQHGRLLSACKQFRDVNEMRLSQARELEAAVHTNATEAASVSTHNAQMRDRLGKSSKGGMQRDTRLKTILEDNVSEEPKSDETVKDARPHKKRQWNTKWLHRRFWLNFIKKKKPE